MAGEAEHNGNESIRDNHLSEAQLKMLLRHVKHKADLARKKGTTRAIVDELIVLLLANAGLRPRELCDLTIADMLVNHSENCVPIRDGRGNLTRQISISRETATTLERFVRFYRKGAKSDDPLLVSERGNPFTYISVYSKVRRIGQKAGIGGLCPHMLRRTYLIRLYEAVQDLRLVQEHAGHASLKTTARYARIAGDGELHGETSEQLAFLAANATDDNPKESKRAPKCEACGRQISVQAVTRIESGQILCSDCLSHLRNS